MKILFLSPSAQLGGAERMLLDVFASLPNFTIHLIAFENGPLIDAGCALGIDARALPMPANVVRIGESNSLFAAFLAVPGAINFARHLRRIVRELSPDVIHSNGIKSHLLSRFIASDAKVVWHMHDFLAERRITTLLLRRCAPHSTTAIAVSRAIERDLRTALPKPNIRVVLNAIDVDHFSPGNSNVDDVVRVGLVATYARWKGHGVFIDAAAIALKRSTGLRFYIIGGPIYSTRGSQFAREELLAKVARLGISAYFEFVDFQSDPREIYRSLDIVVHASTKPEPFGRTIAEAMACGRAVIVSRGGGANELFTDQRDAIGVTPGDVDMLARAIEQLASDRNLRDRLGSAARVTAIEKFDRRRLGAELSRIYSLAK